MIGAFLLFPYKGGAGETPRDLASLLEPIRVKHDMPAMAAAVFTGERIEGFGATGNRKYGGPEHVTINDEFHLGSDTKAMTATLLATFVEQGKLHWSDRLDKLFPDLRGTMNPAYRSVTLEQLLAHAAGFSEDTEPIGISLRQLREWTGTLPEQRAKYVSLILKEPPVNTPGSTFLYTNRSYIAAGAIAERIGNRPWEELLQERIFSPLGMRSCGFGAPGGAGKVDQPWQHRTMLGIHIPVEPGPSADNPPVIGPAGTVHCSVLDWAKFVQAHLRGENGAVGILKTETFRHLHTAPPGGDYGYGWIITTRPWAGGKVLTHAGSNTLSFAVVWAAIMKDFGVVVATNQGGENAGRACDEAATAIILERTKSR